jgi:lysophospholipase L1-like esterase
MRPARSILLACVIAGLAASDGVAGETGTTALATQEPTEIYVALGDSVSTGIPNPTGTGFVERYYAYLQDPANGGLDELHNLAINGETSSSIRSPGGQLDSAVALIGAQSDTKVLTLDIGGNDGNQCPSGFNSFPCPFPGNYQTILGTLEAALAGDPGDETFQVLQYYNPASGRQTAAENLYDYALLGADLKIDCSAGGAALGLNDLLGCIGRQHRASPVDAYPTFKANGPSLMADTLHPNETGHAYLACLFEHPERAGSSNPCEASAAPTTTPTPSPESPAPVVDTVAPGIALSARASQRAVRRRGLVMSILLDEDAVVRATARIAIPASGGRGPSSARAKVVRLGPLTKSVSAGARTQLKLRLSTKGFRLVRKALVTRRSLVASLRVRATDDAGNSRTTTRRVKVVR